MDILATTCLIFEAFGLDIMSCSEKPRQKRFPYFCCIFDAQFQSSDKARPFGAN